MFARLAVATLSSRRATGLLRHLATLCKNTVVAKLPVEAAFTRYTQPTEPQKRAFELLDLETRL